MIRRTGTAQDETDRGGGWMGMWRDRGSRAVDTAFMEGAALAGEIGRPYLEVACLAQLGFAVIFHDAATPKIRSLATTQRRCREAIALAERHGWGTEPVIAPALIMLAATMIWMGEFDEGERWLRRAERALQTDTGPDLRLHVHMASGLLHAGRGRHYEALDEFGAAEYLRSQMGDRTRGAAR